MQEMSRLYALPRPPLPAADPDVGAFSTTHGHKISERSSTSSSKAVEAASGRAKTSKSSVGPESIDVDNPPLGSDRLTRGSKHYRDKATSKASREADFDKSTASPSKASRSVKLGNQQMLSAMDDSTARAAREIEKMSPLKKHTPSLPSKNHKSPHLTSTSASVITVPSQSGLHYE